MEKELAILSGEYPSRKLDLVAAPGNTHHAMGRLVFAVVLDDAEALHDIGPEDSLQLFPGVGPVSSSGVEEDDLLVGDMGEFFKQSP